MKPDSLNNIKNEKCREVIGFASPDFDGKIEDSAIVEDGTRGFCVLLDGTYVVHSGVKLQAVWIEHDPEPVRLSVFDRTMITN